MITGVLFIPPYVYSQACFYWVTEGWVTMSRLYSRQQYKGCSKQYALKLDYTIFETLFRPISRTELHITVDYCARTAIQQCIAFKMQDGLQIQSSCLSHTLTERCRQALITKNKHLYFYSPLFHYIVDSDLSFIPFYIKHCFSRCGS